MTGSSAELSSVASQLDDLVQRVTGIAESLGGEGRSDLAAELFEVERSLGAALRRLTAAQRSLG